jgi:hypothetical protein
MNNIHNSIQGLEVGTIRQRLVYALFLVLGIFFFVASLSTVFEIYLLIQTANTDVGAGSDVSIEKIILRLLYISLNFIVGYSLVFCRKWSMSLFATNVVLMGGTFLYTQLTQVNSGTLASSSFTAFILSTFMFLVVYLFKKYLYGVLYQKGVYITYLVLLLVTFTLTYLI